MGEGEADTISIRDGLLSSARLPLASNRFLSRPVS
jgi:hypothetical protein